MNAKLAVHIIMRVFPGMTKDNPLGLSDKLELFDACLGSLALAVGRTIVKMEVLLDSCPDTYESAVRKYFPSSQLNFHYFDKLGNVGSFEKQLEIACSLDDETMVLLLEDDYFWSENGLSALLTFMSEVNHPCFATPYNHPDYGSLPIHRERSAPNENWRSGISTTCTFAARASTIKGNLRLLSLYRSLNDFGMWLCITRYGLLPRSSAFSRDAAQRGLGAVRDWWRSFAVCVLGGFWASPAIPLYYPEKSGATHMDSNFIGRGIEWAFETGKG